MPPLLQSHVPGFPCRRGKVRDVYDLGDRLVIVATDRISAFDWVLPGGVPDKGRVLTGLSLFWFRTLGVSHHLVSADVADFGAGWPAPTRAALDGRAMVVRKLAIVPFECVVRGYLSGSGWKEYRASGAVCGERLAAGLVEGSKIDPPVFTPATKAESGHDENVPFARMAAEAPQAGRLRALSLEVYAKAAAYAETRGLILADTKFEFGIRPDGTIVLADEVLTPDSSRFWDAEQWVPGERLEAFDKQFVRNWLLHDSGWSRAGAEIRRGRG